MNKSLCITAVLLLTIVPKANAQVIGEVLNRPETRPVVRQIPESSTILGLLAVGSVLISIKFKRS